MFDKLFDPIQIRGMELRNRVVMSAMGTHESAESEDGKSITDKLIAYHVARAKGGNGLNTIEVTSVDARVHLLDSCRLPKISTFRDLKN